MVHEFYSFAVRGSAHRWLDQIRPNLSHFQASSIHSLFSKTFRKYSACCGLDQYLRQLRRKGRVDFLGSNSSVLRLIVKLSWFNSPHTRSRFHTKHGVHVMETQTSKEFAIDEHPNSPWNYCILLTNINSLWSYCETRIRPKGICCFTKWCGVIQF